MVSPAVGLPQLPKQTTSKAVTVTVTASRAAEAQAANVRRLVGALEETANRRRSARPKAFVWGAVVARIASARSDFRVLLYIARAHETPVLACSEDGRQDERSSERRSTGEPCCAT